MYEWKHVKLCCVSVCPSNDRDRQLFLGRYRDLPRSSTCYSESGATRRTTILSAIARFGQRNVYIAPVVLILSVAFMVAGSAATASTVISPLYVFIGSVP